MKSLKDERIFGDCEDYKEKVEELLGGTVSPFQWNYINGFQSPISDAMNAMGYPLNKSQLAVALVALQNFFQG